MRLGPWKLHLQRRELYNLADDIGESRNVYSTHAKTVVELQAFADLMKTDLGVDTFGPGCRPAGRVSAPAPLIAADGTIRPGFEAPAGRGQPRGP